MSFDFLRRQLGEVFIDLADHQGEDFRRQLLAQDAEGARRGGYDEALEGSILRSLVQSRRDLLQECRFVSSVPVRLLDGAALKALD